MSEENDGLSKWRNRHNYDPTSPYAVVDDVEPLLEMAVKDGSTWRIVLVCVGIVLLILLPIIACAVALSWAAPK